jgi:hypothetical protein
MKIELQLVILAEDVKALDYSITVYNISWALMLC